MDKDDSQAGISNRYGMPVAMAKNATPVRRVNKDSFWSGRQVKWRARPEVSSNRLEVAILEAAMRSKRSESQPYAP